VLVIGRLPDGEVVLHLLEDRSSYHVGARHRQLRDPVEQRPLALREPRDPGPERRRPDRLRCCRHVGGCDPSVPILLRPEDRQPDEVDPDPDVLLAGGDSRDTVEEGLGDHPRVEALPDAVGEDPADLGLRVGWEGDLGRVEDRPDTLVGLRVEVQGEIACDRKDPGLFDIPPLVEPEDLVEEGVVGPGRDELVCVVEADDEGGVAVPEPAGDPPPDPVEVARRRCVAEDLLEDAPEDRERGAVVAAVDADRDELPGGLGDLGEDPADGGGLPGSRRAGRRRKASSRTWASRWWSCSGRCVNSKTSGSRKRVSSERRRGECVIRHSGEEGIVICGVSAG